MKMFGQGLVYLTTVSLWVIGGNCETLCTDYPKPKILKSDRLAGLISRQSDFMCGFRKGCPDVDFCVSNQDPNAGYYSCLCKPRCSKVTPPVEEGVIFDNNYCYSKGYCGNCGKKCDLDPADPTGKCACAILDCERITARDFDRKSLSEDECAVADGCNDYKCKVHPVKTNECTCTKPCSQVHTLFEGSSTSITTAHCAKYGSCIGLQGPCYLPKGAKECMCANCLACNPFSIQCEQGCESCRDYNCKCEATCIEPLDNCQAGCGACPSYTCNCPLDCQPTPANCQPNCSPCPGYGCDCDKCSDSSQCSTECRYCPIPPSVCCLSTCTTPPASCSPGCEGCEGYYCGLNQPFNQNQNLTISNDDHKSYKNTSISY